jgi:WD repeat-containing protein 35
MRDETDREPILFHTEICILHMEWNLDGSSLAVAGFNSVGSDSRDINKVIFYDVHGNLLHVLRVPGKAINSIAWEGTGSRFAIAVDSFVYFADIRPNYRWGSLRDTIIYAFPMLGREEDCVMFWNYESLVRQAKFVKNLVGICTAGGHCVLVSQSTLVDQFLLVLCDSMGTIIQSTCVQVNPLFTAMTEQYMAIACQTCVYLWSFDDLGKSGMLLSRVHRAHGGESWKEDDLDPGVICGARSTDEHICALSISKQYILIGVQSGALECHQLPSLNNLAIKHKLASRPRHLSFNCDSTKIGVIDVYGLLTIFELDTKSSDHSHQVLNLIPINHRKDVRDMQWSDDDPDLYAVMEKNRVYIFRGGNPEEPIVSNGNICSFCDLRVKAILLDEVMKDPERPKKEHMIQFETKSLRDMRGLMHHDISFQDVVNFAEANNHNCLWRLLSKSALDNPEYANAYLSFVHSGDYHGVELIKKLKMTKDDNMRQAAIITYFKKFDQAEDMYTLNNQHDHAINLRSNIGDWFKVEKLVRSNFAEDRRLEWI